MMTSAPDRLTLRPDDLHRAAEKGVISAEQSHALWQFLVRDVETAARPR